MKPYQAVSILCLFVVLAFQSISCAMVEKWDGIAPKVIGSDSNILMSVDSK